MSVAHMIRTIEDSIIEPEAPELPELYKGIDWELLKQQKKTLLEVIEDIDDVPKLEYLEGILTLLDSIQDDAVDNFGMSEDLVFDLTDEDEEIEICTGIKDSKNTKLFTDDKILPKMLCAMCNSDNLDMSKTSPREFEGKTMIDVWCNDCQGFHPAYEATFKSNKYKVEGFQVISNDDDANIHPSMDASFCLYSLSQAREMIGKETNKWRLLTIWTGDVEDATIMFKNPTNDPRK